MDLKQRLLGRAKTTTVNFLSEFVPLTFAENGTVSVALPSEVILPVEAILMIPVGADGVPMYREAIGCEAKWVKTGSKLSLSKDGCEQLSAIEGATLSVLVSFPRVYNAKKVSQLLPGEVRGMTQASADVMGMISERDPEMVDRISEAIGEKVKEAGGTISQRSLSSAIEAQINVELTMKHPDLLARIEDMQTSQEAVKAAYLIGADVEFMRNLYLRVPEGQDMIVELMREIEPPVAPPPAPPVSKAALEAAEAEVAALTAQTTVDVVAEAVPAKRARKAKVQVKEPEAVPAEPVAVEVVPAPVPETAIAAALELEEGEEEEDEDEFDSLLEEDEEGDDEEGDDEDDDEEFEDDDDDDDDEEDDEDDDEEDDDEDE